MIARSKVPIFKSSVCGISITLSSPTLSFEMLASPSSFESLIQLFIRPKIGSIEDIPVRCSFRNSLAQANIQFPNPTRELAIAIVGV